MALTVRRVQYFHANVHGEADEAFSLLTHLAEQGVNLLALHSVPMGPDRTQLTLFPDDPMRLLNAAKAAGLPLDGPHTAILVQQEDTIGAIARLHASLERAGVNVYASTAVVDGKGYFGYVIYLREDEADRALVALRG